jgi:hypothetical protein
VNLKFDQLPDYPAFLDVQRALWGEAEIRGAALMVGSGFSRLATRVSGDAPLMPLWSDFQSRMTEKLYPSKPENAPYDPLRLAEEYAAALGRASLDNLIRELVQDQKWNPGPLHRRMVQLPWTDILTTNWDTLLERADGADPERSYEVVVAPQDVARTRSPRIVKLHGSLPSNAPFIFTQEDYRTYPKHFAPFVNLAQQVLLENELCLIGFSGNDPNFLQWIGWVRDQLGSTARPIRLIGVLDLQPSQRTLLTKQNITPIDLAPLVAGYSGADRHSEALRMLVDELYAGKPASPSKWVRNKFKTEGVEAQDLNSLLADLSADREAYPGWLVAPYIERRQVRQGTMDAISVLEQKADELTPIQKGRAAFELCWRLDLSFMAMPDWLKDLCRDVTPDVCDRSQRHLIYLRLSKSARLAADEVSFEAALSMASELALLDDEKAAVAYERCLWFRDKLDFQSLEGQIQAINGADPAWKLRKASMLATLQREHEAALLIRDCFQEIRDRRSKDPRSVWLISREAWAHLMLRDARIVLWHAEEADDNLVPTDDWPTRYSEYKSDPWDELRAFDYNLDKEIEHRSNLVKRETALFDAGTYKRHGHGIYFRNGPIDAPWDELNSLVDRAGLARFSSVNIVETRFAQAGEIISRSSLQDWLAIVRATRKREGGLIDDAFGRVWIARIPADVVEQLFATLCKVIDYGRSRLWLDQRFDDGDKRPSPWVEEVRLLLEIASRLAVRLEKGVAIEAFNWACKVGNDKEFCHWWLHESLSNFMERCLDAIPLKSQSSLIGEMLKFSITAPKEHGMGRYWPNFSDRLAAFEKIDRNGSEWDEAIVSCIEATRSINPEVRTRGVLRLLPLHRSGALKADETQSFSEALWSQRDGPTYLPRGTDVYPSGFLYAPEPPEGSIRECFESEIIQPVASGTFTHTALISISQAGEKSARHIAPISVENALAVLKHCIERQSQKNDDEEERSDESDLQWALGLALSRTIMPAIRDVEIPSDVVEGLFDVSDPLRLPAAMQALPEIANRSGVKLEKIVERISLALASTKPETNKAAISATVAWSDLATETDQAFPAELATEIANACLARRSKSLYGAFYAATKLARADRFSENDKRKLIAALDMLFIETSYDNVSPNDALAVTLTLLRRECVRLSSVLSGSNDDPVLLKWLDLLEADPMPEVRFALSDDID